MVKVAMIGLDGSVSLIEEELPDLTSDYLENTRVIASEISDRQFFQQMAVEGRITKQEALDAVGSGIIPAAMEALIEMLPANQQFAARMLVRGATTFRRDHPVTVLIGQLYGMDDTEIKELWQAASKL